jgi:hypothetical protein
LYEPHELESLKASLAGYTGEDISTSPSSGSAALASPPASRPSQVNTQELERLSQEVRELRTLIQDLQQRVTTLES